MSIKMLTTPETTRLTELAKGRGGIGNVSLFFAEHNGTPGFALVNEFMTECGFASMEDSWRRPSETEARLILEKTISFDMAYNQPVAEPQVASQLTDLFFDLFKKDAGSVQCFSNYGWDRKANAVETSGFVIGGATFGVGVIVTSSKHVGLLLIEDED